MSDAIVLPWKIQQYCLQNNDNTVGPTSPLIRSRLSKESLQQRLLEIAQQILYYDNQLNELVENNGCHNSSKQQANINRDRLQNGWDQLTGESDEIENLLKNKYGMKGGGRLQINQEEIIAAVEMGTQFGSQQQFQQTDNNHNSNNKDSDMDIDLDEEVNSDIDSEQDIEFDYDQSQTDGIATPQNNGTEEIYELNVRRKPAKTTDNTVANKNNDNNAMAALECERSVSPNTLKNETRCQKFKRLEKNWSKNRRYIDPFKGDGLLSKLGEFYEKQQQEQKTKRRKGRGKKRQKCKQSSPTAQPPKAEQFCYKLGSVKIHIENEHLDGVKPEDLVKYTPKNRIKKVSDTQCTYHLPVVLEYFKIVTDIAPKPSRKRRKRRRHKALSPLEGFKLYYMMDEDDDIDIEHMHGVNNKIYLGTIQHNFQSDSILSLLIQLSQNCGALTHRCQIILEQQYVTAQDEDTIEMVTQNTQNSKPNATTPKSEQLQTEQTSNVQTAEEPDGNSKVAMSSHVAVAADVGNVEVAFESATKERDAVEIVRSLLSKYPDLSAWLRSKPNYYEAVQTNNGHALSFLNKLVSSQTEWQTVITQLIQEINQSQKHKIKPAPTNLNNDTSHSRAPTVENTANDTKCDAESDGSDTGEDYVGSDEFVSGLLIVTVYLSRQVFIKRNILKAIKHIKAFDALLDILRDKDEVLGITESFPLPINDKTVMKININEFDTGLLYEKVKPKWSEMCVSQPSGMVCTLWKYQRKAVAWMLRREQRREMVPNLLWREMECYYEDINDHTNNKRHKFWYQIDEGRFLDTEIPQLLDVRGGILADQMGLGKTVECLALINLHKQRYWSLGKPVKSKCIIIDEEEDNADEDGPDMDNDIDIKENNNVAADDCVEPDAEALEQYEQKQELLCESTATLIVTPTNILHQWKNEIMQHSPSLKVYIYLGMKAWKKEMERLKRKRKHKSKRRLSSMFEDGIGSQPRKRRRLGNNARQSINHVIDDMPVDENEEDEADLREPNYRNLGKYDVVLTDYNVLKAESDYSNPLKYTFRRKKRHEMPDTPLLQIRWWRLILDEAQQIESRVSKCAQMALKVTSKHKWCVTGTPIGKNGLDDLYGLIKFLGVKPFNSQIAWLRTVAEPYYNGDDRRLFHILKRIMWRQAKHHVSKELNIPPRKEEFIELTFCGVEHEYYKKLHDDFTDNLKNEQHVSDKYQNFVFNANSNRKKQKLMLTNGGIKQQLEILRQACCHPQISRQTFLNTTSKHNGGIMTMKQIMTKMIEDANDRMTQDERELCRAGTYYSDWLIYRVTHKLFESPQHSDSELEYILTAVKILEEVFKVEQSGIDNMDTETIISGMNDDSIRCDHFQFDVSSLPKIAPVGDEHDNEDDDKLAMMVNDLNEASVSPHPTLKMALSVTPIPKLKKYIDHSNGAEPPKPPKPKPSRSRRKRKMYTDDVDSDCMDDDEDYIPTELERQSLEYQYDDNRKNKNYISSDEGDGDSDYMVVDNEMINNTPQVLTLPSLRSVPSQPIQIDVNLGDNNESKSVAMQGLQRLKVNDNVAVYMFNEWQPAVIIGTALNFEPQLNEIIVHFTHFDERGANMDELLRLDADRVSIEYFDDALKAARLRQMERKRKAVININVDNVDVVDKNKKKKMAEKEMKSICNSRTKHKISAHSNSARSASIIETNEKYYQWKKCEIATSHHLKYCYQRLLENASKFHLSPTDIDILNKKTLVMELSFVDCRQELQEQSEMKVANCRKVIDEYEIQIDQWSRDLKIREIDELVKIRSKIPIAQWKKKQFNKMHAGYNKYALQKDEIQRKLQYACFKLRSINVRQKLNDWLPQFCAIWDKINEEFRQKHCGNVVGVKRRHTFSQYITNSLYNFQRRMTEICKHHRDCADRVNNSNLALQDQVSYFRAKWNDLSDITVLFRVFGQIFDDHKKLIKYQQELKETEEKTQIHCAIVDDFDIEKWTVVGIENHLRNRYEIWKQKALGKSQQLRYLKQKHEILLNAGCRVEQECSICKQKIRDPTLTPCGHLFCEQCILAWLQSVNQRSVNGKACPQCRRHLDESEIFHVSEYLTQSNSSYIHSSIDSVFNGNALQKEVDVDVAHNPKAEMDDEEEEKLECITSGTHIDNIDIVGKGDYGTKIESLVKYLKYLSIREANAKSLVYSQFNQLLSIIAAILYENGIQVIHQNANPLLSRQEKAKRIEKFQTDPSVKVLLLSLRTDSSGLTLIQATHVFLLEPSLNEAIELQAIDRVHRVGQTKHTFVHRYFMKGTVEENILRQRYQKLLNRKKNSNKNDGEHSGLDKGQNSEQMTIQELRKLFGDNSQLIND